MALNKSKKQETKETNTTTYTVTVTRAKEIKDSYAFDMEVNGIKIYGCWLKESKNGGNFISFPSYKGSDGKYYSHVWFNIDEKLQEEIEKQIEAAL